MLLIGEAEVGQIGAPDRSRESYETTLAVSGRFTDLWKTPPHRERQRPPGSRRALTGALTWCC
jgi:hypothetical protein